MYAATIVLYAPHQCWVGISASPEALTRDVIHLAWHIHTYSHIQMMMTVYRDDDDTIQFLKLEIRIGNVPRECFEKLL